ncbi:hypothetical protein SLEP1_g24046 [Rubroshorea leprosula]|uniref:Uncharacterized protein n=1 Tax=Rubroshorea leprosula TaxID=152421 RepID=A0AAV5JNN1_9ROSI|nr:hypothetical protein SLEP1_g24046 [Rubroshorea leprosula]
MDQRKSSSNQCHVQFDGYGATPDGCRSRKRIHQPVTTPLAAIPAGSSIPSPTPLLVNYTSWTANQTFNLGDYLIFRTINEPNRDTDLQPHYIDASDKDTLQYN